jgi:hypothetical protein
MSHFASRDGPSILRKAGFKIFDKAFWSSQPEDQDGGVQVMEMIFEKFY